VPTLKQLRCLAAIADTRHFARAAALCNVTQPTLSAQLANLEKRLGVVLVERNRNGAVLTPVGRHVVERARAAIKSVDEIFELIPIGRRGAAGVVRLGILPTLGPYLIPEILAALRTRAPQLKLYVREDAAGELETHLRLGKYDVALTSVPVISSGFKAEPLFWEPYHLALPRKHAFAAHAGLTFGDLKGETVLTLEPQLLHDGVLRELCADHGATLQADYEGTSLDTLRSMVGAGMGVALLPALYVKSEIGTDSDVRVVNWPAGEAGRTIGLVWRSNSPRAATFEALARVFRDAVRDKFDGAVRILPDAKIAADAVVNSV
jgi:LysR family transcriptional regulator, hydrogen peroxide-inducible genes activator